MLKAVGVLPVSCLYLWLRTTRAILGIDLELPPPLLDQAL